jgi:glycosyltransferase involved in cell wall biosynthesis
MTLVSVVIPCFNQGQFLGEAIQSVAAQTYEPIETIVIDDGSTDNTFAVANNYGVQCIRQANSGLSRARNAGMKAASGQLLLFLDADDLLARDAIAAGVACLENRPGAAFVFGQPDIPGIAPGLLPPRVESDFYRRLLERNYIGMPGLVLYRRSVLDAEGGFATRLDAAEDYDLYLRIARKLPIWFCDDMHGTYRRHSGSMSNDSMRMFRGNSEALRSQRKYVGGSKDLYDAYRRGNENVRRLYGYWAVMDTRMQIGTGKLLPAASSLATLLKYDQRGFVSALFGGIRHSAAIVIRRGHHAYQHRSLR